MEEKGTQLESSSSTACGGVEGNNLRILGRVVGSFNDFKIYGQDSGEVIHIDSGEESVCFRLGVACHAAGELDVIVSGSGQDRTVCCGCDCGSRES
jgi:hypothetical protein